MKYISRKKCKESDTLNNTVTDTLKYSPKFIIFYTAKREGVPATGQTESMQDDPDMAKAEAVTKLIDLGYTNIEILAIETAGKKAQQLAALDDTPTVDINEVFK